MPPGSPADCSLTHTHTRVRRHARTRARRHARTHARTQLRACMLDSGRQIQRVVWRTAEFNKLSFSLNPLPVWFCGPGSVSLPVPALFSFTFVQLPCQHTHLPGSCTPYVPSCDPVSSLCRPPPPARLLLWIKDLDFVNL